MIKRHTFENGFQLVYQKSEQSIPVTCIHVFCNVGSAYEIDPIRGASHLVEHMCFKGTHDHMEPRTLLVEYNKIGARINAYTEKRVTCYTLTCDDAHSTPSIMRLADMLLHSAFSRKEFNKEQHVVVEENIRTKDNHAYMLEKSLDTLYFRGSSYEHPIDSIHYHPNAAFLKYEDMLQWYKWFYRPGNMVCSIVSNLSFDRILHIIQSSVFTANQPTSVAPLYLYPTHTLQPITNHFIYHKKKGVSALHLHLGFRTCGYHSKDKYIITLLTHVLNGFSGRLFTAFRTKRGLTYHSSAETTYHEHMGYLHFSIETNPMKILQDGTHDGILPILLQLIADLIHHGITEKELRIAKGNYKGKSLLALQSIDMLTEYNGINTVLHANDVPLRMIYKTHIEPITCAQVHHVIRKYITYNNLVVGIVHDHPISEKKIEQMCTNLKW